MLSLVEQEGNPDHVNYCQQEYSYTQKVETSHSGISVIFQVMADNGFFKQGQFREHLWLN